MTETNIKKQIIDFAWPVLVSTVFTELYNITNSAIVGNYVSLEALSAVSACTWICNIFSYLFFGLGMGAGIVVSRNIGKNDKHQLFLSIDTAIIFGIVGGTILTILSEIFLPLLMKISNINSDIYALAYQYLRVYFIGNVFSFTYNISHNIMRSFGHTKQLLYYSIISCLVNLGLGILFVRVFDLSVVGTSLATIISQFVSLICCFVFLADNDLIETKIYKYGFSLPMAIEIFKIGIPAGFQNMLIALSSLMIQSQVNLFPNEFISGFGVGEKVANWGQRVSNAFSSATLMLVARYMGGEEYDKARLTIKTSLKLSNIYNTLVIIVLFIFAPQLATLFNRNQEIITYATQTIRFTLCSFLFLNFSHIYNHACRAAGNVKMPMFIAIFTQAICKYLFVTIGLKIVFSKYIIYFGNVIGFSLAGIIAFIYFNTSKWTLENHLRIKKN